jgi:hypothetical protein
VHDLAALGNMVPSATTCSLETRRFETLSPFVTPKRAKCPPVVADCATALENLEAFSSFTNNDAFGMLPTVNADFSFAPVQTDKDMFVHSACDTCLTNVSLSKTSAPIVILSGSPGLSDFPVHEMSSSTATSLNWTLGCCDTTSRACLPESGSLTRTSTHLTSRERVDALVHSELMKRSTYSQNHFQTVY